MQCPNQHRIRVTNPQTGTQSFRYVRCRLCLACRLTRQYNIANRLQYDVRKFGPDRCWFWTGTFRDRGYKGFPDHLCIPYTEEKPAGVLNERQEKALPKLLKIMTKNPPGSPSRIWAEKLIEEMYEHQAPRPTLSRKVMRAWRDSVRHRIGYLPRMVYNGEMGSKTHRPHDHAIILDMSASDAQATVDAWPYSDERKEIQPLLSEKIGAYIAKDVVKGSPQSLSYIASGREPPFMGYPRNPYLAQGQEEDIYRQLSVSQQHLSARRFEECVQLEHLGRTFQIRTGTNNRKIINVPHGETAYRKALARIERDEKMKKLVGAEAARNAHLTVTHTTEGHPHFCEEHYEHFKAEAEKAERKNLRAGQRHKNILARKGIGR